MVLRAVTVDTNVLMHADNPNETEFAAAVQFLQQLSRASTLLSMDEGFCLDTSKNKSRIGHEYLERLVFGGAGYAILTHLALTGRIDAVCCKSIPLAIKRKLNQIVSNVRDRTFLLVTCGAKEKFLVSHDFRDFSVRKRTLIKKQFAVDVKTAAEALGHI
ncbi:MAG: hypothetical protein WC464_07515 [Bdellovibrionales bacterium]